MGKVPCPTKKSIKKTALGLFFYAFYWMEALTFSKASRSVMFQVRGVRVG